MSADKEAPTPVWDANAGRWTRAVRERRIASRTAGTDAAILDAIVARAPARLLDAGCGEGWLVRVLRDRLPGCRCVGVDGSAELVAAARAADPDGDYRVLDYAGLAPADDLGGPFDVVVFNYALFEADLAVPLAAAKRQLASGGAVLIQTLPPAESEGWREEDFAAFGEPGWTPMRWYARTRDGWRRELTKAGLEVTEIREPRADDGTVLSLLLVAR